MTNLAPASPPKMGKGQFKCFHCRNIYPQKDGSWHHWNSMEVHLCKTCDRTTKERAERRASQAR